jgi:gamma-glutamyltranspeptidase/glutathione hydrolase
VQRLRREAGLATSTPLITFLASPPDAGRRTPLLIALLLLLAAGAMSGRVAAGVAAVAAPEAHATQTALSVLRQGGNAVDAAVATAFVLSVTLPDAGNLGGGGFMTLYFDGAPAFLDYRETAPAAAGRDMYLMDSGAVDVNGSLTGHRASGVPGTVAGLWEAHRRYGTLPWAELVSRAIELAESGYRVPGWLESAIAESRERLADTTNFLDYYGKAQRGERFRQPELAATLRRIAARGADDFYRGRTAQLIAEEMQRGNGLIALEDLAGYQPKWRDPIIGDWRNYRIVSAPPPSSGGIAILQYLQIKALLADAFMGAAHNSVRYVHLKSEIEKRIFADRAVHLGDPDFVDVPVDRLLDPAYLQARATEVDLRQPSKTRTVQIGAEPMHTTHFSILDGNGNAVSNTYTLNTDFGSGVVVTGAGFLLNNEMDDFSVAPGQPNYYGVVGDEANAIVPGKRMLSSMAPTILLRKREDKGKEEHSESVAMILGAMGGSTIFTSVYQMISNIVEFGMSPGEAQAAPRVHHQLVPDQLITYSPTTPLPAATVNALRELGYRVEPHDYEFGNVQLIWVDEGGKVSATSDPRFAGTSGSLHQ